ncbi:MAG: insulinase family protein [Clostridiales bacterium]|jgi:predicted Zn-dependent peptidase|nr:insulinase family protein [Clostridiales bacterium]
MDFEVIEDFYTNEKLYFARHGSGLRVYVSPKKFTKKYAIIGTQFGSIDNTVGGQEMPDGIAHFLEHKLFEQPGGGNAFDEFSRTGASANAYTSFSSTCYLFSATRGFDENLRILLDFVFRPYFTDENVAKEQGIIAQEIKMYDDEPGWRVFFNLLGGIYHNHPVRKDIAGTVDSIGQITPETLTRCYSAYYHPSNMALVVVGDVDLQDLSKIVDEKIEAEKYANAPANVLEPRDAFSANEPPTVHSAKKEQKLAVSAPIFMLGFKDAAPTHDRMKREIAANIAREMLFGKCSAFYQRLYEKGLINDSFDTEYSLDTTFAYASIGGESPDPYAVRAEVADFLAGRAEINDVQPIKNMLIGQFLRGFNSPERAARTVIDGAFRNVDVFKYAETCEAVTRDDVIKCCEELFRSENMAFSVIEPQKPE